jgi:hypothetical protein
MQKISNELIRSSPQQGHVIFGFTLIIWPFPKLSPIMTDLRHAREANMALVLLQRTISPGRSDNKNTSSSKSGNEPCQSVAESAFGSLKYVRL